MKYRRSDIPERRIEIEQWIMENRPKVYICRELNCKPETLETYFKLMGIAYSGNQGKKGQKASPFKVHASNYLVHGSLIRSHDLKLVLLRDGLREHTCQICNLSEWQGGPIPLELHHIDGDPFNNIDANLQLLCPNCHALTPNFSGKGKRTAKAKVCGYGVMAAAIDSESIA